MTQPGPEIDIDVSEMHFEKKTPEVPQQLHAVLEINKPIIKDPGSLCNQVILPQDVNTILNHDNLHGIGEFKWSKAIDMTFDI